MPLAALLSVLQALQTPAPEPAAPRARGWHDFPVFVWRETHAGKPLPAELAEPFGGVILMRNEDSGWARERGLAYLVWNVAGRDALHLDADEAWNARVEQWIATQDERLLVREPCLNDPETIAELYATLDATLAKHGEHPGLGFVLGDEVSLTPNGDPFDLCRCGLCQAEWKAHARENGLPERAPLTDEVRTRLLEDDFSLLGAWLARRRFDEERLRRLLLRVRERGLGRPDPGHTGNYGYPTGKPRFGLLGCNGVSAFGGVDIARCAALFDFIECYPVTDVREQLLGQHALRHGLADTELGATGAATLATIFVADETPDGTAWKAWEHWLRGGRGLVLWSDAALARSPEHLARLTQAVSDIRALVAMGIQPRLEHTGGALVNDRDSIAASFLREALLDGPTWPRRRAGHQAQHGTRERSVRSWLRWIEDAGQLPASIPLEGVRSDCVFRYGYLVLPEILVLDERDIVQLEQFVAAGGTLFVDGTLGWVDRSGQPREEDTFERLRAKAPERVRRAPPELASYLDTRLSPGRPPRSAAQVRLGEILAARARGPSEPDPALPALGAAADRLPWLVARSTLRDGASARPVFVLLPNLTTAGEQRGLGELELAPVEGATWIHPRPGERLRAGDAAVLAYELPSPR